jgi:hypothetical protein
MNGRAYWTIATFNLSAGQRTIRVIGKLHVPDDEVEGGQDSVIVRSDR